MLSSIKKLIFVLAVVAFASTPGLAQTATFDDLPGGQFPVPPGYTLSGSVWDNIYTFSNSDLSSQGYPAAKQNCSVSDPNCVFNGSGTISSISRAGNPFDFTSAYFLGWADYSCSADIFGCAIQMVVTGYNAGLAVASSTITMDPFATTFYAFNFSGVDNVTFDTQTSNNGGASAWYLGDNFVFNQNEVSTVPEPGSMALLGTGLVGLYGVVRRRRGYKQI